jgi:hypothetical protein
MSSCCIRDSIKNIKKESKAAENQKLHNNIKKESKAKENQKLLLKVNSGRGMEIVVEKNSVLSLPTIIIHKFS